MTDIVKKEFESLNDFQKSLHFPASEVDDISSNFYRDFKKISWSSPIIESLDKNVKKSATDSTDSTDSDIQVVYKINPNYDYLITLSLRTTLPLIYVNNEYKDKMEIAWPRNLQNNIVKKAVFKTSELDRITGFDNVSLDLKTQFYRKAHEKQCQDEIGNYSELVEWTTKLPPKVLNTLQPYYFIKDQSSAIPIFLLKSGEPHFVYEFKLKIKDLLKIRVKGDKGEWVNIDNEEEFNLYTQYLNIKTDATIPTPEIWGRYKCISSHEREWRINCQSEYVYYIEDFINVDSKNPVPYETNECLRLDTTYPCQKFFFLASNCQSVNQHNFSNYTTNKDDISLGFSPINNVSLAYNGLNRFSKTPFDIFSSSEPRMHCLNVPCEIGYGVFSYSDEPNSLDADPGLIISSGELGMNIKNNDYLFPKNDSKFICHVRMLVVKKLTIINTKIGNDHKFTISIN